MKYIEVDEQVYRYIASKTEHIGESASDILRRLLGMETQAKVQTIPTEVSQPSLTMAEEIQEVAKTEALVTEQSATLVQSDEFKHLLGLTAINDQKGAVGRFLFLLLQSYHLLGDKFSLVLQVQGRGRLYFALTEQELLNSSKAAKPRAIGDSGFWVATNSNTDRKRRMLSDVLILAGCSEVLAEQIAEQI
ncbi:replication initiation negative regulator SeqA [Paraferrimonas sp. SM1919]|uniref:replication initiation negative regulator SeqA n=1 Tax=Paraferrimonas sp. SM1919 TaxID=2662263 RepID=UPI0013D339BE|nr:replication initiation negative regulator SeqA [Paraferrimonas sp. SM1919]